MIAQDRLEKAAATFSEAVLGLLKRKSTCLQLSANIHIDHDIMRYVLNNKGQMSPDNKFMLHNRDDFIKLGLPCFWDYYLDELGQGQKVIFPIKLRLKLGYSSKRFVIDGRQTLTKAQAIPMQMVMIFIIRRACTQDAL